MGRKKKVKQKLEIVFDPKSRREFLTGFHKRKNERKKRAKEKLEELLKAERKRIRQEVKDSVKHLKKSYEPIPELEHLTNEEEYENNTVTVKIMDLSADPASQYNCIGANKVRENSVAADKDDDETPDDAIDEVVPGMSVVAKVKPAPKEKKEVKEVTSKKDINRITKRTAVKSLRKNKLFKMKSKLDSAADKKKARKEKRKQDKLRAKQQRRKGKFKVR